MALTYLAEEETKAQKEMGPPARVGLMGSALDCRSATRRQVNPAWVVEVLRKLQAEMDSTG